MRKKPISIQLPQKIITKMDEKRKDRGFSRNQLFEYLLKKWFENGSKIIMED